jgi:glucose-1-phosphate adenylyltransferase
MHDVLVLILGGGRGDRLFPLTKHRSEPAVPIGGKYRLIDIPISNCFNSSIRKIYVLTQYMSVSLHRHIANTYKFTPFSQGFVEVLAAQQTNEKMDWFQGTADAIRQNVRYVQTEHCRDVLVLYGDQLYRMDFQKVLATHHETQADVTVSVLPVHKEQTANYGIVKVDATGRIVHAVEKPSAGQLADLRTPPEVLKRFGLPVERGEYLANMGIYFYRRDGLLELLDRFPKANDMVREILIQCCGTHRIQAHVFDGYWQDVGSVKTYYEANLALTRDDPPFDFHDAEGVIYTRMRNLPASQILGAHVEASLVSDGCRVEPAADLKRCVLGVRSHIRGGAKLRDVVMLGANFFEGNSSPNGQANGKHPPLGVGEGSVLEGVILDKNCRIGKNVRITNKGNVQSADGPNYFIRDGIVVIPNSAVLPDGTVI